MGIRYLSLLLGVALAVSSSAWAAILPSGTVDDVTKGDWLGVYGAQGYILASFDGETRTTTGTDRVSLPSYISGYSLTNVSGSWIWNANWDQTHALRDPSNPDNRVGAMWYCVEPAEWSVTLTPTQTKHFKLGLYIQDPDLYRTESITFTNAGLNGTDEAGSIDYGRWITYEVSATAGLPLTITIGHIAGPNTALSAITFDEVPEPMSLSVLAAGALLAIRRRRRA